MEKIKHVFILDNERKLAELTGKLGRIKPGSNQPVYKITVEEYKENRSLAQNRLLWVWMKEVSEQHHASGGKLVSDEIWHEYFKELLLPAQVVELRGQFIKQRKSTRKLNTKEFTQYLENIDHYCGSELEVQLPHPEDIYYSAMGIK